MCSNSINPGQSCGEASNGREALDVALKTIPDIAVLDLMMPEMNGLEATPAIKRALPKTEVLSLTLHETDELISGALDAGARGYARPTLEKTAPRLRSVPWKGRAPEIMSASGADPDTILDRVTTEDRQRPARVQILLTDLS
jgi:chemotaxis response regulator CheB